MRFALLAVLATASLAISLMRAADMPPVPRKAPEFVIHFPGGQEQLLSQYRGKVIALEFAYTTCPHCQHASQVFNKLYTEYGSKGFEPVTVAFNEEAPKIIPLVTDFVKLTGATYPVGYASREQVLNFLQFSVMERFVVPQIVWIDRTGTIREETPPLGDEKLLSEAHWREMIETLTKEPATPAKKTTAAPHHTGAAHTASTQH